MNIAVIIPTYNEAGSIGNLVTSLLKNKREASMRIIVSDGGSTDDTLQEAKDTGADLAVVSPQRSRAAQMNYAASLCPEEILYFVHADVKIHPDYITDIAAALKEGYDMGCYRYKFDSDHPLLKVNSFFTRFPFIWCRGGDQTLFVKRQVFENLDGYRSMRIMEEYDFIKRAKEAGYRFKIIPKDILVSARKYETNSYFKVLYANYRVMKMWKSGKASDEEMAMTYKRLLNYR
ncbi:TIGR04283 family arsenosugar biosynthesis glycosyltransferase [Aridibaculum aurantiacum]|uniref:TIGR04283 family arsenosugar biosynthesis glycosyltransferase n=1 Tax=Aridibaculum aurantiacum TaxID=2810307 RepID=UPI001A960705|nr:TIGR04283 family arsenosugar biosynthesis glycosyltransferase [Aridibaculum aurantiacum]